MSQTSTPCTVGIYTLGCKVNQYESEAIAEALEEAGFTVQPPHTVCDAYVINTCTVTSESDRKARQFIRRAVTKNANAVLAVTGCLAQTAPEGIAAIKGVDIIVGNGNKMTVVNELSRLLLTKEKEKKPKIFVTDITKEKFEPMCIKTFGRTRAYVKIEDGWENRCTYCIIPSARGLVRSKPLNEVVREVTRLTESGCREVVLTGIETASWGKDLGGQNLADLLCAVDDIPGIGRVRLGSLDPSLIQPEFVKRIAALPSLAPHFHLSLQSGSSRVLARMKRKYHAEQARLAMERLRAALPSVQFSTDVIVGFPGETEEEFAETLEFLRTADFLTVHLFPYSKRKGTPAESMPHQIPSEIKRRRLHELEAVARSRRESLLKDALIQSPTVSVLFETFEHGCAIGHTPNFLEVSAPSPCSRHGEILSVRLTHTDGMLCYGEIVKKT